MTNISWQEMRKHLPIWHHRCTSRGFRQVPDLALHHWEKLGVIGTKRKKKKKKFFTFVFFNIFSQNFWVIHGSIRSFDYLVTFKTLHWPDVMQDCSQKTKHRKGDAIRGKKQNYDSTLVPYHFFQICTTKAKHCQGVILKKKGEKIPN